MASGSKKPSLFKRMKKGSPLSLESRQIILNVYAILVAENPNESLGNVVTRVADITGVSMTTVWRLKADGPTVPKRQLLSNACRTRPKRTEAFNTFTLAAIRRIVHDFIRSDEPATVENVTNKINEDERLPTIEKWTLRRLLLNIGFTFVKGAFIDSIEIQSARRKYLRAIRKFREDGRPIYYLDETSVTASELDQEGQKANKVHKVTPLGHKPKKNCLVIGHAGNEKGFVNGAQNIFLGDMDDVLFENWFTSNLLPNIPKHSVIVMDEARYHSVALENIPHRWTRKADMQAWLSSKGIGWSEDMVVPELMIAVDGVRERYHGYRIDTIAQMAGHTVLRLPPNHGELNPIELVWRHIKDNIVGDGGALTLEEAKLRAEVAIALETAEEWATAVQQVIKEENQMWDLDNLIDSIIDAGDDISEDEEL